MGSLKVPIKGKMLVALETINVPSQKKKPSPNSTAFRWQNAPISALWWPYCKKKDYHIQLGETGKRNFNLQCIWSPLVVSQPIMAIALVRRASLFPAPLHSLPGPWSHHSSTERRRRPVSSLAFWCWRCVSYRKRLDSFNFPLDKDFFRGVWPGKTLEAMHRLCTKNNTAEQRQTTAKSRKLIVLAQTMPLTSPGSFGSGVLWQSVHIFVHSFE